MPFLGLAAVGAAVMAPPRPLAVERTASVPEISITEALMRGHAVLNRVMLIYDESIRRLATVPDTLPPDVLADAAAVVREFVDVHEQFEEAFVFPPLVHTASGPTSS